MCPHLNRHHITKHTIIFPQRILHTSTIQDMRTNGIKTIHCTKARNMAILIAYKETRSQEQLIQLKIPH